MESTVASNARSPAYATEAAVPPTPTTPSASSSARRFLLAENRYGREEMLALMPDQPTRAPMNSEIESILLDEAITPLALLPLTEDEQRILAGPVNSYSAYKRAPPNSLPVRGRGGRPHRGRGRGDGGTYPRSLSTSDEHMGNGAGGGEWGGYYPGGAGRAITAGWSPGWEGTPTFSPSRGDKDSNWRSPAKDPNGKWNTPPSPGGLARGSSWKGRENKDRWLPGWAQSSKEGGEGEGKGEGLDEQPDGKDKEVREKEEESSVREQPAKSQQVTFTLQEVPPRQPKSSSPWGSKEEVLQEESPIQLDPPPPPRAVSDPTPPQPKPSTLPQPTQPTNTQRQAKPPTTDTIVFPSALTVSKETIAAPQTLPTSLPAQGLAGIFSTPNFTPTFGSVGPPDTLDQDRFEKAAEALLSNEDEETVSSTKTASLLQTSFNLTPTVTSIIGPKAEATPTEQPQQQAPPPSHTVSKQQKPQTVSVNHTAPPKQQPQPQQVVQSKRYSEADMHSWYYKDPQSNVQGPFPSSDMKEWFDEGYFTLDLMVRRACDDLMLPLGQVIRVWGFVPFVKGQKPPPPIKASEPFWSNLFSQQTALFQQQQAYMMQAQQLAQVQAQAQQVAATQQLLAQQQQLVAQQQKQTSGVPSTMWSLTAAGPQAAPQPSVSVVNPVPPTVPPTTLPSTAQETQPQRQLDKGKPPQQQRQKKAIPQESDKREVVEQPKVAEEEQPPPVDSTPSQWPSFKDVWDSTSSSEEEEEPVVAPPPPQPPAPVGPWGKKKAAQESKDKLVAEWRRKEEEEKKLEEERRRQREEEERERRRKQKEEEDARKRQEEEKRKQLELVKKREEQQQKKQAEAEAQKDLWSQQEDVEMVGGGQAEGGIDQLWSDRGGRLPWIAPAVTPTMGAPSLLEIQEQEFKHAEQRKAEESQQRQEVYLEQKLSQQNKASWAGTAKKSLPTPTGGAKSFAEIQREQEEAMQRVTSSITQTQPSPPAALFGSAWTGKSPNPTPYNKPPPGWASKEPSSKPTSSPLRVSAQVQRESASFWEEVMEGSGNDYDGSSGDVVYTHRNSAPTGPAHLGSRDKGEGPKKKAPPGGAEAKRLPPPCKEEPMSWKPTEDFIAWCEGELGKFEQRADSTVFLEYLQGCSTPVEIHDMIMTLFEEEASKAREFAHKFIEKRQKMISGARLSDTAKNPTAQSRSSQGRPLSHTHTGMSGASRTSNSKKAKKGKKGQKVDPVLLGFSVHAAERPNIGEIQSLNNTRR